MELMSRMGYEGDAQKIQDLSFEGKREEAIPLVPTAFADEISLVGPKERIRDRLRAGKGRPGATNPRRARDRLGGWRATPVTRMISGGGVDALGDMAELVG